MAGFSKAEWTGLLIICSGNEKKHLNDDSRDFGRLDLPLTEMRKSIGRTGLGSKDMLSLLCPAIILVEILYRQLVPAEVQGRVGKLSFKAIRG